MAARIYVQGMTRMAEAAAVLPDQVKPQLKRQQQPPVALVLRMPVSNMAAVVAVVAV